MNDDKKSGKARRHEFLTNESNFQILNLRV